MKEHLQKLFCSADISLKNSGLKPWYFRAQPYIFDWIWSSQNKQYHDCGVDDYFIVRALNELQGGKHSVDVHNVPLTFRH